MKLSNINFNDVYFTLTVMILKIGLGLGLRYICSDMKRKFESKKFPETWKNLKK